eukprot:1162005-Pelagomonas_calceolata.AAC.2
MGVSDGCMSAVNEMTMPPIPGHSLPISNRQKGKASRPQGGGQRAGVPRGLGHRHRHIRNSHHALRRPHGHALAPISIKAASTEQVRTQQHWAPCQHHDREALDSTILRLPLTQCILHLDALHRLHRANCSITSYSRNSLPSAINKKKGKAMPKAKYSKMPCKCSLRRRRHSGRPAASQGPGHAEGGQVRALRLSSHSISSNQCMASIGWKQSIVPPPKLAVVLASWCAVGCLL